MSSRKSFSNSAVARSLHRSWYGRKSQRASAMTRAKRYEGEALRAKQWHNLGLGRARERKRIGVLELERIVRGKFNVWCGTKYDPIKCAYLIVTEIGPGGAYGPMGN